MTKISISLKLNKTGLNFAMEKIITECSVCKKIKEEDTSDDLWVNRRILASVLNDPNVQISHGYCPECREKLKQSVRNKKNDSEKTSNSAEAQLSIIFSPEIEGLLNALIKKGVLDKEEVLEEIKKLLPKKN